MNLIDLLTLVASAHGFFLGTLILHKYRDLVANRFLASLLFLEAGLLLEMSLQNSGFFDDKTYLLMVIIGSAFLIGPLHYLYAKHLTRPSEKLVPREVLHVLPFLLYQGLVLFKFISAPDTMAMGTSADLQDEVQRFGFFHVGLPIQYCTYLFLTLRILREHGHRVQAVFSSLEKVKLNWLRNITWLALSILVLYALEFALLLMGISIGEFFGISSVFFALNVYAMGYLGLFNSEVLSSATFQEALRGGNEIQPDTEEITPDTGGASPKRYAKSGLNQDDLDLYQSRLLTFMEDEAPQADSGLTLDQLAGQVGLSPHNLSEVVNRGLGQHFFDFVNGYRVRDVQKRLLDPEVSHLTVLALALEAGFASKSTFNAIFKKHTGLTPTAYRKAHSES